MDSAKVLERTFKLAFNKGTTCLGISQVSNLKFWDDGQYTSNSHYWAGLKNKNSYFFRICHTSVPRFLLIKVFIFVF